MARNSGRCMVIPVSLAGLVAAWSAAVLLVGWDTLGGPSEAGKWGLLASAAAASWTVLYGLAQQQAMLVEAYRAGRDRGLRGVTSLHE